MKNKSRIDSMIQTGEDVTHLVDIVDGPKVVSTDAMRTHVETFAKNLGWSADDGEGAFEFIQRKSYKQGWEDGKLEALNGGVRDIDKSGPPSKPQLTDEALLRKCLEWIDENINHPGEYWTYDANLVRFAKHILQSAHPVDAQDKKDAQRRITGFKMAGNNRGIFTTDEK